MRTQPATSDTLAEFTADRYPCQRENTRKANQTAGISMTTTYTPIDANTERVRWTNDDDGTGYEWTQRWDAGLDAAPAVGQAYSVHHDEWIEQDNGDFLRIIHAFTIEESLKAS